jgi:SAM-dependent methyltransferase
MNSYDLVPYPGGAVAPAHCRRLETVAALFQLAPVPPASARVLELGCGTGNNVAPQALAYPTAQFIGCDSSASAVAAARELVQALGLANVEFRCQDLCQVDANWGKFDYILCHGVFSWVGAEVRRRILEILRDNLAPQGIGYVSYNALPGWHLRGAVRDLLRHHASAFEDPAQAIAQARAVLALAAQASVADDPYSELIRDEYFLLSRHADAYLYHDMLEEYNQPFYFHEFLKQIGAADLQYLGAAEFSEMFTWDMPTGARAFLDGKPVPEREQYLDYLRGCAFKRSLVCQAEVAVERRLDPQVLDRFAVALTDQARLEVSASGDDQPALPVSAGAEVGRLVTGHCELTCPDPLTLAALRCLDERWPEFVPVSLLRQNASGRLRQCDGGAEPSHGPGTVGAEGPDPLMRFLLDAVTAGAIEATLSPPCVTSRISDRPLVSPLVRVEAQRGNVVTNQRHESIRLTAVARLVAGLLDGTRDRRGLLAAVSQELKAGRVSVGPFEESDDVEGLLEEVLSGLCRRALLVG